MSRIPVQPAPRWLVVLHAATAAFAILGMAAMFTLSPRVIYADSWRYMTHFMTSAWPAKVLEADNGHRELFPNLVRVLELEWLHANQWLQITVGAALALATVAMLAHGLRREPALAATRAAALFFAVAGIFWLGNERALAHGNESVHAYLVTLCLVTGCWLAANGSPAVRPSRLALLVLLGAIATFSFGSGIACFFAFALVLVVRRAPWSQVAVLAVAATAMAALHVALGNSGPGPASGMPPVLPLLRWLAAPFLYTAWPLLDAEVANQLPIASARAACLHLASALQSLFGPAPLATWPGGLFSLAGIGWLLWSTLALWRVPDATPMQCVAAAISWFALVVGMLVCISRATYFIEYPDQVVAPRYLPWSSLFWSGLAMLAVLRAPAPTGARAAAWALLAALLLSPSQLWMAMLAKRTQALAENNAVGAVVGVLGQDAALGENVPEEISSALPLLRKAGTGMFAWPEARAMGKPLPAGALAVPVAQLRYRAVVNRLGAPGHAVSFTLEQSPCRRLVLADAGGAAAGMAIRQGSGAQWQGWARSGPTPRPGVFALCGLQ